MRRSVVTALAVLFLSVGSAAADDAFHPVPATPHRTGALELRVVSFGNGIHGEMQVEVKNPGGAAVQFFASGLYFTPDPDGGEAPQRMGIIGGIRAGVEEAPRDAVTIAAGATRRLRFDVYCIDRARHAPSSTTTYTLAASRMPVKLVRALDASTGPLLAGRILPPDQALLEEIQGLVWNTRGRVRVRLSGE